MPDGTASGLASGVARETGRDVARDLTHWGAAFGLSVALHLAGVAWLVTRPADHAAGGVERASGGVVAITLRTGRPPAAQAKAAPAEVASAPQPVVVQRPLPAPTPAPRTSPAEPAVVALRPPSTSSARAHDGADAQPALPDVAAAPPGLGDGGVAGDASDAPSGSGAAGSGGAWSYHASVSERVQGLLRYPRRAQRAGDEGTALVRVRIDRHGRIRELALGRSSGSASLDRDALRTVRRASPFGRVPDAVSAAGLDFDIPVIYALPVL